MERKNGDNDTERYVAFFADEASAAAERSAFAGALEYCAARPDAGIYYYSKYERTMYRKLQQNYPESARPSTWSGCLTPIASSIFTETWC